MKEIVMPKLGLTMTEGTVAAWHKAEGDAVKEGEAALRRRDRQAHEYD